MAKNLLIVESPAKAKTIEKILGKDFQVKSPSLVCLNPAVPYSWENCTEMIGGVFCLFTETFPVQHLAEGAVRDHVCIFVAGRSISRRHQDHLRVEQSEDDGRCVLRVDSSGLAVPSWHQRNPLQRRTGIDIHFSFRRRRLLRYAVRARRARQEHPPTELSHRL